MRFRGSATSSAVSTTARIGDLRHRVAASDTAQKAIDGIDRSSGLGLVLLSSSPARGDHPKGALIQIVDELGGGSRGSLHAR